MIKTVLVICKELIFFFFFGMRKCFEMFEFDFVNMWPINKSFMTHCYIVHIP